MGHGRIFLSFLIFLLPTDVLANDVVQRPLKDPFVDTFFLENVGSIRAQMPPNWGDPESNFLTGVRIDNRDSVVASSPYATFDDMLLAFYDNQHVFNEDPTRNRIMMFGSIKEIVEQDGTVIAKVDIT